MSMKNLMGKTIGVIDLGCVVEDDLEGWWSAIRPRTDFGFNFVM